MDEPVLGRRAAIYATERKRLPPSFYWGLAIALGLHAGAAYYVLQTQFVTATVDPIPMMPDKPTDLTMERPKPQKAPLPPHIVHVHDTPRTAVPDSPPLIPVNKTDAVDTLDGPPVLAKTPGEIGPTVSDSTSSAVLIAARWAKFPDGAALVDYYPAKASEAELEGQATVQCTVLDNSGRVSCIVVAESPGGFGFGTATVRMVQDKGRVDTSHGDVAPGSMLRQTVHWRLN